MYITNGFILGEAIRKSLEETHFHSGAQLGTVTDGTAIEVF